MLQEISLLKRFCSTLWEYDPAENTLYIHHDDMLPASMHQWHAYEAIYEEHVEKYIDHEDLPVWKHYMSPAALQHFQASGRDEIRFFVRTHSAAKGNQWHEAHIIRHESHLVIMSRDIQENASIAQGLLPEFDYVCRIDIATKSYVLYYAERERTIVPMHANEDYEKVVRDYNHKFVVQEEIEPLCRHMEVAHVMQELQKKEEYILYATVKERDTHISYKKLRFCYADKDKKVLLLTRIDVTGLMQIQKEKEKEQQRRLAYLEHLPLGFCSVEVLLDEQKRPTDFRYTYCNRAHEAIEGVKHGELIGQCFYQYFKNADPKWLPYYYETAYQGIPHIIKDYSPEIQKYLVIYTFQTEVGHCDCLLINITKERFLEEELHRSREEMKRILQTTTSFVFQYFPTTQEISIYTLDAGKTIKAYPTKPWLDKMTRLGYIAKPYLASIKQAFAQIQQGEHHQFLTIRARTKLDVSWSWYRLVLFDYLSSDHSRKVLGYLQNIDHDMATPQVLQQKADTDPLTGILNVGGGKKQSIALLEKQTKNVYSAMFIFDIDNFKSINDTQGHMTGDEVLKRFSSALYDSFRSADIVYRLGGDEFAAFATGFTKSKETIEAIMNRFYRNLAPVQKTYPFLTCSIGIYVTNETYTHADIAYETYYAEADKELYHAKKHGKNQYSVKAVRSNP